MRVRLLCIVVAGLTLLAGCGDGKPKQVGEQRSGDYVITVLSDSGSVKKGENHLTLEFRKAADNQLADPGNVRIEPVMEMKGSSPMTVNSEVKATDSPGRYSVQTNLAMAGAWKLVVQFGEGHETQIDVHAE